MPDKREAALERPENVNRLLELATNLRQSWEDGFFGSSFNHWEDVTAESKVGYLAECAAHHGVSFDHFVEGVRIGLNVPDGYEFNGDDQWHLHRQFREGQQLFKNQHSLEAPLEAQEALFAEWRSDYAAARARDYGEADAATYDQRVRDGAATINHLTPEPSPLTESELARVLLEVERAWGKAPESEKAQFEAILRDDTKREVTPDRELDRGDRER